MSETERNLTEFYGAYPFPGLGFERGASYLEPLIEHIRTIMDPEVEGVWLDIGCGTGEILSLVADCYPGLQFIGVDLSEQSLAMARKHAEEKGVSERVTFHRVDVRDADFGQLLDGQQAAVISGVGSLHYLENMSEVVHRLFESLASDGVFLIGVYGLQGRWRQEQLRQACFTLVSEPGEFALRQRLLREEFLPLYRSLPVFQFLEQNFGGIENVPNQWWQDTFLIPYERQFRAEEVFDLLVECGSESVVWLNPPDVRSVLQGEEWLERFTGLPQREQIQVLDRTTAPAFLYMAASREVDLAQRIKDSAT